MHKSYFLSILMLVHCVCAGMATQKEVTSQEKAQEAENLQRWYTRAKIGAIITASVIAVLAYKRLNKSLDNLEVFAANMQPGIQSATAAVKHIEISARGIRKNIKDISPALKHAKDTLKTVRSATRGVHTTLKKIRPSFAHVPYSIRKLRNVFKNTNLTMRQIHATAKNAQSITAKFDALINPQVILASPTQQAIQATTASVAAGLASVPSTTPAWTPSNVIGAVATNSGIITTAVTSAVQALRAPVPSAAKVSWRWFGWFRR